jgi:hypothetical protein
MVFFMFSDDLVLASLVTTLDQSQENDEGSARIYSTRSLCQTFTCGISGLLTKVSLNLSSTSNATISIIETDADCRPDGTELWTRDYPTGMAQGWFDLDITSTPYLMAGTVYGIKFTSYTDINSTQVDSWRIADNSYTYGKLWENRGAGWQTFTILEGMERPTMDTTFKTYMTYTVPEPATLTLLAFGVLALIGHRRKRE